MRTELGGGDVMIACELCEEDEVSSLLMSASLIMSASFTRDGIEVNFETHRIQVSLCLKEPQ